MTGCPESDVLQGLLDGKLDVDGRAATEQHVDDCDECRRVIAALARTVDRTLTDGSKKLGEMATQDADPQVTLDSLPPRRRGPARLPAGTWVGRYVVRATLGAGGMGVVYRAEDPALGREVALKLLRGDRSGHDEERRLVREGQALARIAHPNVIAVHDVGTHDGRFFVAMELVDGGNLRSWLAARRRPLADVLGVMAAAGRGLAAAHAAGIVHRDFKPDNVLVGRDGRVRVTDFGLARAATAPGDVAPRAADAGASAGIDVALTDDGVVVGSPAYMSPEQLAGDHVDARSDQFGFSVALHEALYGVRPFDGANLFDLEDNVVNGRMVTPPADRAVPAAIRAVTLRGLAVRPGDRWPSMDHLLVQLGKSRARGLRALAAIAASLALAAGVGVFADWLARERALTAARAGFAAATDQLARSLALRSELSFGLARLSFDTPVMRDVTANRDQADFGLGAPADDEQVLRDLHDLLVSADWMRLAVNLTRNSVIALLDYKGRLLYTTAAPERWGHDALGLPAIKRALTPGVGAAGQVVRGDDPALVASGIAGGVARPDTSAIVFAWPTEVGGAPRAVFVQIVDADALLADVALADGTLVALVAPDGTTTGAIERARERGASGAAMPRAVVDAAMASRAGDLEVDHDGAIWLVHRRSLGGLDRLEEIARIVLARPVEPSGLFAGARPALALALASLLAIAAASALASRRTARLLGGVATASPTTDAT